MERVGIMAEGPRIKGRVGQVDTPKEWAGKWCFEISLWTVDGETLAGDPMTFGPFETEKKAHEEMQRAVRLTCEVIEMKVTGQTSGKYFDLKAGGVMRPWEVN